MRLQGGHSCHLDLVSVPHSRHGSGVQSGLVSGRLSRVETRLSWISRRRSNLGPRGMKGMGVFGFEKNNATARARACEIEKVTGGPTPKTHIHRRIVHVVQRVQPIS